MKKKIFLSEKELIKVIKNVVKLREQEEKNTDMADFVDDEDEPEYDPREKLITKLKELIETDEDFDESIIDDIYDGGKPFRRGRGSIYVDVLVPETDDKEFDRKVALKMLDFYQKQVKDETYVGGVGFKQGLGYDNMDF